VVEIALNELKRSASKHLYTKKAIKQMIINELQRKKRHFLTVNRKL